MTATSLEPVYDALAQAIDAVGPRDAEVFLAKLCLALAHELDDEGKALATIAECREGFDTVPPPRPASP